MTVILTMLRRVEPEANDSCEQMVSSQNGKGGSDKNSDCPTSPIVGVGSIPTSPTSYTRRLYHVTVPASKYDLIKSIADLLVGESYSNEYLDTARERCARIALAAVVDAVLGMRKTKRR